MDRPRPASRLLTADRIAALVFLALVAVYGWEGARFSAALQVDVVGPAFFPKILAVAGLILGVMLLLARGGQEAGLGKGEAGSHLTAFVPVLLLLGYVLILVPAGFLLATAAFLTAAFRYLGYPGWKGAVLYSMAITAAAFVLFHVVLEVRLPLGILARLV